MSKNKSPRKRKEPTEKPAVAEQPKAELVPVAREPQPEAAPERALPALADIVQAVRMAVGRVLDLADAAAEAIKNRIEGRA
jgi:hypothetical protein